MAFNPSVIPDPWSIENQTTIGSKTNPKNIKIPWNISDQTAATNHCIEYKNEAFLNESIKLKTYIKKYSGATCTRVVEITNNQSNTVLALSETKWCLINAKTKRPARITSEITDLFM